MQYAIGLGSNLGDSHKVLRQALQTLQQTPDIELCACSSWYQTEPVGPPQPDYINGCAILSSSLKPETMMQWLLTIEQGFGRIRRERWGPRILDLDLLLCEQIILDTPLLQIPHPRMTERAFVLVPLAEIAPDWVEPISGKVIIQLRETVDCSGVHPIAPADERSPQIPLIASE